jgi:BirA family biotin operon repressor/biotin-[acetyl-CoA-carboxylase] ligase
VLPGFTVEVLPEIDSTNTELMRRARTGQTEPVLLVAERQTAGRGRLGRPWASDVGASLTFSLGLPLAPTDWSGLSLAVGVALAESLHRPMCASNGPTTCGCTSASWRAS